MINNKEVLTKKVSEINGFEEFVNYILYSDSRLFNVKTNRFLQGKNTGGYLEYSLSNGLHQAYISAHRLVALAFVPNNDIENKIEVDHIEPYRINQNNDYTNLRWVTRKENNERVVRPKTTKRYMVIADLKGTRNNPQYFEGGVLEASRELEVSASAISKCLYNNRKSAGGYEFSFAIL